MVDGKGICDKVLIVRKVDELSYVGKKLTWPTRVTTNCGLKPTTDKFDAILSTVHADDTRLIMYEISRRRSKKQKQEHQTGGCVRYRCGRSKTYSQNSCQVAQQFRLVRFVRNEHIMGCIPYPYGLFHVSSPFVYSFPVYY